MFILNSLNTQQQDVWCIYINYVRDVKAYVSRYLSNRQGKPNKFCFVVNVGKTPDGKVFIGSDAKQGCHWVLATYDTRNNELFYGDSLGWDIPDGLQNLIKLYNDCLGTCSNLPPSIIFCHDPEFHYGGATKCNTSCKSYPFQTCMNICGVVALIMCSIFCLDNQFFEYLLKMDFNTSTPYIYLKFPTKYNKYLRQVLMTWVSENQINIDYILPNETALLLEHVQYVSNSDIEADLPQEINISDAEPIKEEIKVADSRKVETIEETESGGIKTFKCPVQGCPQTCAKKANLVRHVKRFHDENATKSLESGNCLCLQCGYKCRRIVELRKHLSSCHNNIFRMENLEFESMEGMWYIL